MRSLIVGAVASALATVGVVAPSFADETWKSLLGQVVWEKDYAGGAVFLIELEDDKVVKFYIENLRGEDDARGNYDGYWLTTVDDNLCSATLTGPDGTKSRTWGRLSLTFVKPGFPSDWVALAGDCMKEPKDVLVGETEAAE